MTVNELIGFLSDYDGDCQVRLLQCSDDNPLRDDIGIEKAIGIEDSLGENYIVLIPN